MNFSFAEGGVEHKQFDPEQTLTGLGQRFHIRLRNHFEYGQPRSVIKAVQCLKTEFRRRDSRLLYVAEQTAQPRMSNL
ncbi:MAG TPA: hypothetical protein VNO32_65855, partial [Candidatus Acidoferrum sp.]|nr:hypothetical protein [Candidatus Acidoferrum sp.]